MTLFCWCAVFSLHSDSTDWDSTIALVLAYIIAIAGTPLLLVLVLETVAPQFAFADAILLAVAGLFLLQMSITMRPRWLFDYSEDRTIYRVLSLPARRLAIAGFSLFLLAIGASFLRKYSLAWRECRVLNVAASAERERERLYAHTPDSDLVPWRRRFSQRPPALTCRDLLRPA